MDEEAARERMRQLAEAGDHAGALSEYVRLEAQLKAELGVAPARETRRLLERIRSEAAPPLGTGGRRLQLVELEGDHTEAERAELNDGEEDAFESVHLGIHWEDHDRRVVLKDGGRMVACAGLIVADVTVAGQTFPVVGFGGVIVTRTRRGEGLARTVMEGAIERAKQFGPDYGLLFCRPDRAGLYAKLGFAKVDAPVDVGQPDDKRIDMPLDTMWLPLRDRAWPEGPVSLPGLPF
jgi:predicted N-acetyltransferase YhbS